MSHANAAPSTAADRRLRPTAIAVLPQPVPPSLATLHAELRNLRREAALLRAALRAAGVPAPC